MTLQTCAPENFRSCRWGNERTVKRVRTVSEDPHRHERNLEKTFNKQKAASKDLRKKEHNHIHTSNNTHNFRGANNMSTPTKRKDFGGGGGAVQSLLYIFEDTIITKPTRGDYQESPAKRRKCGRQGSN